MLRVSPVPAFADNYIWVLHDSTHALVVDPGDAAPVQAFLAEHQLTLAGVLITHGHIDHIGGVSALRADWPEAPVYGPADVACVTQPVGEGESASLPGHGEALTVWATPGHTANHLSYLLPGAVFCGDTLFACGCGRVFDGTPTQLHASLQRLAALPDDTQVYCTHEYTLANQRFARHLEPDNAVLLARCAADEALRAQGLPTVPTTIGLERQSNPFLRVNQSAVRAALAAELGEAPADALAAFTALREWKNRF